VVGCRLVRDAFEGKGLGVGLHVVESTKDRKRGLTMVPKRNMVAIHKLKVRSIPFKHIFATSMLAEQELWTQEANLGLRYVIPITLKHGNTT
jgi:hypothetical protein